MRSIHRQILLAVATSLLLISSLTIPALSDTIIYTYDDLNHVTAVEYGDGSKVIYTYDENGNRLKRISGKKTNTITSSASAGGSITPSGAVTVDLGTDQNFTITPEGSCYHIADVTVDSISQGAVPSYSFISVFADHTIAANFALNAYTITATAGSGGTVAPPSATVNCGGNQTIIITPDEGYYITDVTVDNISQGAIPSYPFTDVTADHTLTASFAMYPIKIIGTPATYYTSLQTAYNAAADGATIQCQAGEQTENLTFNLNKSVTLVGGYNPEFTVSSGVTTIHGAMSITSGAVLAKSFDLNY